MATTTTSESAEPGGKVAAPALGRDFWIFWSGQTISNLGSSITTFLLPLLIFRLTGSALNLAFATAAAFLPYPLFGLIIGSWVDRADRRRVMIGADLTRALVIASIPLLALTGHLGVWWIYVTGFVTSTLGIAFSAAEFAAIPSLVARDDLVTANGRIQASFSAATIAGPLLAGPLLLLFPPTIVLLLDALSFVVSSASLVLIRRDLAVEDRDEQPPGLRGTVARLRADIVDGLRYVLRHSVLRAISAMMALINFAAGTQFAQLVLFAKERLGASDSQLGLLYSSGSIGVVLLALLAGWLRRRWPFSRVALGALLISGLLGVAFALNRAYWLALVLWALIGGLGVLFNINTGSLRQAIVPNHLLGRVLTIAQVLAWSATPLGVIVGGIAIERSGNVALVYAAIGALTALIALAFAFSALGHAERYLPPDGQQTETAE